MPGQDSIRLSPLGRGGAGSPSGSGFPLAVLLALDMDDGGDAAPSEATAREQSAAVFAQDEYSPAPASFVAETAFDCEGSDATADWLATED